MPTSFERYLVTAALPYANGPIHIGQLAGSYISPDTYVRFKRLKEGEAKVLFICGSDEHGTAIETRAKKEGLEAKEIVDRYHTLNASSFEKLGISFNYYHRTSSALHHETAQEFFKVLNDKGAFELKETEQLFDVEADMFLADRYVKGTCPVCDMEDAYGDQCEKCGSTLSPTELLNPVSTISGSSPQLRKTKHWYLKLDQYQDWLRAWLIEGEGRTETWKKNVLGQCKSWLEEGLHPRAMTRDLDWGVKVPLEGAEGKVLYVWLDAPIGYISSTKQWAKENAKDWEPWWKDEGTKLLHFLGKDNIVFHCIIFPSILKEHGGFILPTNIPANEFMNLEGQKMSTSRNWTVWLHEYLEELPHREDELRYVLTALMPESKDSEFTWKEYQDKVNNELVAVLGNFVNRVMVLSQKYFDSRVQNRLPELEQETRDVQFRKEIVETLDGIEESIESYRFREAQERTMELSRLGNRYLTEMEPWQKFKDAPTTTGHILNNCLQLVAIMSVALEPFLPQTAAKIKDLLNIKETKSRWDLCHTFGWVMDGHQIAEPQLLFEKVEDDTITQQIEKLKKSKTSAEQSQKYPKVKAMIEFADFEKVDIRVGTILEARKAQNADKLLVLQVDLGFEKRQIVSGIAESYEPDALPGKKVSVLVNLKPRKIRGEESNGMILLAEDESGKLVFVNPDDSISDGSVIK